MITTVFVLRNPAAGGSGGEIMGGERKYPPVVGHTLKLDPIIVQEHGPVGLVNDTVRVVDVTEEVRPDGNPTKWIVGVEQFPQLPG